MDRRQLLGAMATIPLAAGCRTLAEPEGSTRPIIIAHRGLSGEWPEHTLAAYRAAIVAGTDYIEPDLVLTKDGVLIARHENMLSDSTDIADHPHFADRRRTKIIDGQSFDDWFSEDFTLAEIKTLRARERLPELRGTANDGRFEIPTFDEILALQAEANRSRPTPVGIYPETKHPSYFAEIGLPHETPLLTGLKHHGLTQADSPVFIQSFETANLRALAGKTRVRLIQLMRPVGGPPDRSDISFVEMMAPERLAEIARYAYGIGPSKDLIMPWDSQENLSAPTGLVADAHAAGLKVHPWTFRRENGFLPASYRDGSRPGAFGHLAGEIAAFLALGIDGLFTDNVPEVVAALGAQDRVSRPLTRAM